MGRVARKAREFMHKWNLFEDTPIDLDGFYAGPMVPNSRPNRSGSARHINDKSFVTSIYNRIGVDVSMVQFYHAILNEDGVPVDVYDDSLNNCLTLSANIDQTSQGLFLDAALTMMEQGIVAIVPMNADIDPISSGSYNIEDMRVARVVGQRARKVTIEVYDDRETDEDGKPVNGGVVKQVTVPKEQVALIENPFFSVMNEPNGTLQRLMRKLAMLDGIDEAISSGKLDMLIQLSHSTRAPALQKQAEERRDALRQQLMDDELGIGYIDVNEKVIQLNRPLENKLLEQIQMLMKIAYDELGITPEIMNGTATADAINQYQDRVVEVICNAFALEMKRKFLTSWARNRTSGRHSIEYFRDPLRLIPISELAEIVDKLRRNGVVAANEIRPKIGLRPSKQPGANDLSNPNMPDKDQGGALPPGKEPLALEAPKPREVADARLSRDAAEA